MNPMKLRSTANTESGDWQAKENQRGCCAAPAKGCSLLPVGPRTTSPVPELTSLHSKPGRGPYGDAGYRGNCSGLLIRDLLRYYQPQFVLDPMSGGGTCADVCRELSIHCLATDLTSGVDATSPDAFTHLPGVDFVWLHPPYWRMIRYSDHPACLSNSRDLDEFCRRLEQLLRNCRDVLLPHGVIAILMGDWRHQGRYLGLPFRTYNCAVAAGLRLDAPEIVRFQHGATSSRKHYDFAFIPRLHDVCLVLKQDDGRAGRPERKHRPAEPIRAKGRPTT